MFYNMFVRTGHMRPTMCSHSMPIRHITLILSWGKSSDRIENVTPLFIGLSFLLMDCIVPSVCVTEAGVPDSMIDRKIKKYSERYRMSTLFLY
jgi:hypothetical protein